MTVKELGIAQFSSKFLNEGYDTIGNGLSYGSHPHFNVQKYLHCTYLFARKVLIQWPWWGELPPI
jgi:hypothetical protein